MIEQEQNSAKEATPNLSLTKKSSNHSRLGSFLAGLALFLALLSLLSQGILWQQQAETRKQIISEGSLLQQKLQPDFQQLKSRIDEQQKLLNNIVVQNNLGDKRNAIALAQEALHLVTMSQYNLVFDNNIDLAARLLVDADQKLQETNDPLVDPARREIATDLVALNSIQKVDITAIAARLDAMTTQVDNLASLPAFPISRVERNAVPKVLTWQDRLLESLQSLKSIVSIRRLPEPLKPLPSQAREAYQKEAIRLHLAEAKWGLLHQNPTVFINSLNAAKSNLASFQTTTNGQALIQMISALEQVNVKPSVPDLSNILSLIKNYISTSQQSLNAALSKSAVNQTSNTIPRALPS